MIRLSFNLHPVKYFFVAFLLLCLKIAPAQNYQAINGSSYAGSLGTGSNPSTIIDAPFAWDITLLALQGKQSTNAFITRNYSFLSRLKGAYSQIQNGDKKRFYMGNQDIRLLNSRFRLNTVSAIAFGVNIRTYASGVVGKSNWQDTATSLADFMKINSGNLPLTMDAGASSWAELYGTYARTIMDDGNRSLNAGITLKLNRAIGGGYAHSLGISYSPLNGNIPGYALNTGTLQYGYSANFDNISGNNSFSANRSGFLANHYNSISADVGFEYVLLPDINLDGPDDDNYNMKIGVALMDLGGNRYSYGRESRVAVAGLKGVTDTLLENKFYNTSSLTSFNDSLSTVANSFNRLQGAFEIYEPTRLVINIDKHIQQYFFMNAELTVPVISIAARQSIYIRDMNLLALTPRWETRSLGAYLPVLVNTRGQVWVGGAVKAGPLLFGVHNFSDIFSKNKTQNGGLYLAFTVRPGKKKDGQSNSNKLTRRERRSLDCPRY